MDEANIAGVCLLVTADEVSWRYLDALITSALEASSLSEVPTYASIPVGDLFELANVIACRMGGAATIEDPHGRVLAHSSLPHQDIDEARRWSIVHRQASYHPGQATEYEKVRRSPGPVRLSSVAPDRWDRLAVAVRAGGTVLGTLWILDGQPGLDEQASKVLEEVAHLTAFHLMRTQDGRRTTRGNRAVALNALLDGRIAEEVAADQIGFGLGSPTILLAVRQAGEQGARALDLRRVVDLVEVYCEALHPQTVSTASGETVYALLEAPDENSVSAKRLTRFAEDVARAIQRTTSLAVHIALSGPASRLSEVAACRFTADLILEALAADAHHTAVATIEEVHSRAVLLQLLAKGAAAIAFTADPVEKIIHHDQRHSTTYTKSLLTYLDAFGEASRAAAALGIHENTLRYRIKRIHEVFGIDLNDAETRLVTWLGLRLRQIDAQTPSLQ
ncbi:helix-turn-helix domain-containing protein [Streptomyces canus]|uniref:PucR family transcriptional regulator n=1 Tax=Streptomyces canus TaxID=58343 RepID=UPI0033D76482